MSNALLVAGRPGDSGVSNWLIHDPDTTNVYSKQWSHSISWTTSTNKHHHNFNCDNKQSFLSNRNMTTTAKLIQRLNFQSQQLFQCYNNSSRSRWIVIHGWLSYSFSANCLNVYMRFPFNIKRCLRIYVTTVNYS